MLMFYITRLMITLAFYQYLLINFVKSKAIRVLMSCLDIQRMIRVDFLSFLHLSIDVLMSVRQKQIKSRKRYQEAELICLIYSHNIPCRYVLAAHWD